MYSIFFVAISSVIGFLISAFKSLRQVLYSLQESLESLLVSHLPKKSLVIVMIFSYYFESGAPVAAVLAFALAAAALAAAASALPAALSGHGLLYGNFFQV